MARPRRPARRAWQRRSDLTVGLDEVWGRSVIALGGLMDAAATPEEALAGLQRHVVGRLAGVSPRAFVAQAEQVCACGHEHAASFTPLLPSRPPSRSGSAPA